jgi:hypothetical protein
MAIEGTSLPGFNYLNYSDYVFSQGLNMPNQVGVLLDRGGLSNNWEAYFDANTPNQGSQEYILVHYPVPNNGTNAVRWMFYRGWEDRVNGSILQFNVGNDQNSNAFEFNQQDQTQKMVLDWNSNKMKLFDSMGIAVLTNNVPAIIQSDTGTSSFELLKLDNNNILQLRSGGIAIDTSNTIHSNSAGLAIGNTTNPIENGVLIVSDGNNQLLRFKSPSNPNEFYFGGNATNFYYGYDNKNIVKINNDSPADLITTNSARIGLGGNNPFGKVAILGQDSNINLAIFGLNGGDGIYLNGTGVSINIMRGDLSASDIVRLPISNNSIAANASAEVNISGASISAANMVTFGDNATGWQIGVNKGANNNLQFRSGSSKLAGGVSVMELQKDGAILLKGLKTATDDVSAGLAGCAQYEIYKTLTGELRIKN